MWYQPPGRRVRSRCCGISRPIPEDDEMIRSQQKTTKYSREITDSMDQWMEDRGREAWVEASVVEQPRKTKNAAEPRVLVRRNTITLLSPDGNDIAYFPEMPCISLFTGAGGFDLGMERAGFCSVVQHEIDDSCCQTLMINRPNVFRHSALIQGDIRLTPTSMLLREAGLRVGEAYVLTGGPPCQGFSTSNSNRGKVEEKRNDLVFELLRVVREAQPKFFIFENVPGFQELSGGEYFELFLKTAYGAYYELVYGMVNAVEYGVPQDRTRFMCIGTRRDLADNEGLLGSLPRPQCFAESDLDKIKIYQSMPLFHARDEENLTRPPGIRYFPDRPILRVPRPTHHGHGRSKTFLDFYRKLEESEPDRIVRDPVS